MMIKTLAPCSIAFFLIFAAGIHAAEISKDAKRYMFRGQAALEDAKDVNGFKDAVREFKKSVQLAPGWGDAWYNLGVAQEKAGAYAEALQSFKKYLQLNPNAADSNDVEARMFKLEYRAEKSNIERMKIAKPKLDGVWRVCNNPSCYTGKSGCGNIECAYCGGDSQFKLTTNGSGFEMINTGNMSTIPEYQGAVNGNRISGEAIIDLSGHNRGVLRRIMKGDVTDNGKKLTMNFQMAVWLTTRSYAASCVFIKK